MKLDSAHIEAIRSSGIMGDAARLAGDNLYDAAIDALLNDAPLVEAYEAIGAYDELFPILVRGVPGVYFVSALEFDPQGPFITVEAAQEAVEYHFGEFEGLTKRP